MHLHATAGTDFGRTHRVGCPASAMPPDSPSATASVVAGRLMPRTNPSADGRAGAQTRHPGRGQLAGSWRPHSTVGHPDGLLDSYHNERHPVAAAVLDNTRAQMALLSTRAGAQAMRRSRVGADGLRAGAPAPDTRRSPPSGSATTSARARGCSGRRQCDVTCECGRSLRVDARLRGACSSTRPGSCRWRAGRTASIMSSTSATNLLAPAMLLRPDGHIAWAGDEQVDLAGHLPTWFWRCAGFDVPRSAAAAHLVEEGTNGRLRRPGGQPHPSPGR